LILYLLKKIAYGITVLFGVVCLVFLIFNLKPGDPSTMLVGQQATKEGVEAIKKQLNYDLPAYKRFAVFVNDLSPIGLQSKTPESRLFRENKAFPIINFSENRTLVIKAPYLGKSFQTQKEVSKILSEALPATVLLAVSAILLALVFGLFLGTYATLNHNKPADYLTLLFTTLGMAGPSFFMAILISWIGGYLWFNQINIWILPVVVFFIAILFQFFLKKGLFFRVNPAQVLFLSVGFCALISIFGSSQSFFLSTFSLPGTGLSMTGTLVEIHPFKGEFYNWKNLILPALTLGIRPMAVISQLTRSSLLEVLEQDYIRTARAKGLPQWRVFIVHGLRNALTPVVTAASGWFAGMLAGAVFIEYVFGWKGLGMVVFTALELEDLPVVMGSVLLFGLIFVVVNLFVDFIYTLLDPRVRA
jgi:peptide/nickel transport system permease protein